MTQIHRFGQVSLLCHAFNGDSSEMALSVNSNDVFVFKVPQKGSSKFVFLFRLQQHTSTVRSIDWAPKTDRIVSCSTDRNAYVWTRSGATWKPTLVILQLNRAATFTRWSPLENKFAVGSGAKVISVCSFEADNDFWVSKQLKKGINSTVTCLDWHPDNNVLACGSTDFKVRIFGAHLKSNDKGGNETNWGNNIKWNNLLWESDNKHGWIHSVTFSGDGNRLAWSTHSSTVCLATVTSSSQAPIINTFSMEISPLLTMTWIAPNTIVAAGHDCVPYVFNIKGTELNLGECLDSQETSESNRTMTAFDKFQRIDRKATSDSNSSSLMSKHQNTINEIRLFNGDKNGAQSLTTIGREGLLIVWDLKTLQRTIPALKIM